MVLLTGAFFTAMTAVFDVYSETVSLLTSSPRTLRAAIWAVQAGQAYKSFFAVHAESKDSDAYNQGLSQLHTYWAQQLLHVCRANGGVYIKAGQFASAFGAVPREYRVLLAQLEDKAVPRPYAQIRRVLLDELGPRAEDRFTEFEPEATAAASLAQVHRAVLVSGEEVAVKLQYPGLRTRVTADLLVMKAASKLAGYFFPDFRLGWLYDELEKKLEVELDFRSELHNACRLAQVVRGSPCEGQVSIPRMHPELSGPRVLVMEWIRGTKLTDAGSLQRQDINPHAVGLALVKLFAELTFVHGYVHGDPHPGNIMVRPTGKRSFWHWLLRGSRQPFELVLLDHGTYLDVEPVLRQQFCQLWCAFLTRDADMQRELSTSIAGERGARVLPVLLTQTARSREEEAAVRQSAGIRGFGDIAALLASAPRDVVEVLRINTVVRASSNQLGVSMEERKRIMADASRRGLPPRSDCGHLPHVNPRFGHLLYRLQIGSTLLAWEGAMLGKRVFTTAWSGVLSVFGEVLFD